MTKEELLQQINTPTVPQEQPSIEQMRAALKGGGVQPSIEQMRAALKGDQEEFDVVDNETHPEITWGDRAAVKNFATTPEVGVNYLKKKHPDFEVKQDASGEIILRKKGEPSWKRLDPTGFDLADITDIGYDVASGIGTGLGTAATAVGTGGLGAIGAGAGLSAASETAKQGIGSALGMENNLSGSDVLLAGGIGGLGTALFGSGATAKDFLKKGLAEATKQGLGAEAAEQYAELYAKEQAGKLAQKGLAGAAWDKAKVGGRKALSLMADLPDESLKILTETPEVIDVVDQGKNKYVNNLRKEIAQTIKEDADNVWAKVEQGFANSNTEVDISDLKQIMKDQIAALENLPKKTSADLDKLKALKSTYKKAFKVQVEKPVGGDIIENEVEQMLATMDPEDAIAFRKINNIPEPSTQPVQMKKVFVEQPDIVPSNEAYQIHKILKDESAFKDMSKSGVAETVNNDVIRQHRIDVGKLSQDLLERTKQAVPESAEALDEYARIGKLKESLKPITSRKVSTQTTYSKISNIDNKAQQMVKEAVDEYEKRYGISITPKIRALQAQSLFGKTSTGAKTDFTQLLRRGTPLALLGGGVGYTTGIMTGEPGYGPMGAGIGMAAGGLGANPMVLKKFINAAMKSKRTVLNPTVKKYLPQSAWRMMELQKRGK